jgi:hypothetical protein
MGDAGASLPQNEVLKERFGVIRLDELDECLFST